MVRRLVEEQHVCLPVHELAEADFRLLTTGEDADLALDVLRCKAALCESGADLILGVGREFLPDLLKAGRRVARRHLLFKVAWELVIADLHSSGDRRDQSLDAL